ncbi:hypothetical protein Tco_1301100 [Tanacetum coccineum]
MVSLLVSKVDRLECALLVYTILPVIPNQSQIIWEIDTKDESSDSDTEREGSKGEGPGSEDEGPGSKDEGSNSEDEGTGSEDEGSGSDEQEEEAAPEGQQQAVSVMDTAANEPLGLGYGELRRRELAVGEGLVPSTFEIRQSSRSVSGHQRVEETPAPRIPVRTTWVDPEDGTVYLYIEIYPLSCAPVQTPASPEWSSGSLLVSPSSLVDLPFTTSATTIAVDEDEFLEVERGHVDARRAEMWQDRYDDHRLIHYMLVQHTVMQRKLQEMRGRVATLE